MAHTPGPWHWENTPGRVARVRELHDSKGVKLLYGGLDGYLMGDPIIVSDAEEAEGNSLLIAAAPELLSLLQRAAPYMKTVSRNDTGGYSDNDPTLYEDILAAIAKARGA